MFTFCVSEKPLENSAVGITLHLILEDLFKRLKNGDRFWFEHDEGFTEGTLRVFTNITSNCFSK